MIMKRIALLFGLIIAVCSTALAQRTISGTIVDDAGESLIGANVVVKGTTAGTVTDIDGSYTLEVPEGYNTLVVSYTGYDTQELELGASNIVDLTMSAGVQLSEVVVTGLGIKKEKKALGYGVTTVSSDAIEGRNETDVARILRGKTTGVDITSTSGLAGSGTSILIRGFSSITGDNQPLFVVDGVPFNTETNSDEDFIRGGAQASSRFLDLDPNNIAEINILKGLSATVLYGEAGRNGVVLVTTKTGELDSEVQKGFEVSLSQSVSWTEVANLPEYQNTYGNGFSGNFGWFFSNWGPSFDTRGSNGIDANGQVEHPYSSNGFYTQYPSLDLQGSNYNYQAYESVENFFQTGLTSNTSLSISKMLNENSRFNASYSYLTDEGFAPDLADGSSSNEYNKHNLSLGAGTKLANGLKIGGTFQFITSDRVTPPIGTSDGSGPTFDSDPSLFSDVLYTPRSIDLFGLPFQSELDGSQTYYRQTSQITHPLWTLNNSTDTEELDRFFGTLDLSYELTDWLFAQYRVGIDQYTQQNTRQLNKGGQQFFDGSLTTSSRLNNITTQLLTLNYDLQLNDDLDLAGIVGGTTYKETKDTELTSSTQQFVYGLFTHDNFINTTAETRLSAENTLGLFATATLGYRNYLYLNVQARNDWTSTLESDNQSEFYPSANVSFIPTEAIASLQNNNAINYLKLRFGIGTSAGYPNPYQTRNVLSSETRSFVTPGGTVLNTNSISDRLGNATLDPEKHVELEAGIEARFWGNRIGIDLSLYDKESSDLIIDLELDPATGFENTTVNAATVTNRGVELGLNVDPFRGDFRWNFGVNFTHNENTVDAIDESLDIDQIPIAGFTNLGNFAIPGQPFAVIQGSEFERVNGELKVTGQGFYEATDEIFPIGDPNPDYKVNYINTLSWKGLSLNVNVGYTKGGDIYSGTASTLLARGNTIDTEFDRFLPFILEGVTEDGSKNTTQIYAGDAFFEGFFGPDEGAIFDGTVVRLREVGLNYTIPSSLLSNTPFGSLSIGISGENLWYNAINFPAGINFDPEVLSVGVTNGRGLDFITAPTAKKYGVNLTATF
jgi:TonB-linked SusC/RagA family outer membrane protein